MNLAVSRLPYVAQVTLIALVYVAVARLSLALAIPPGYATPVWPPSGIALAAMLLFGIRSWPGVWLGAAIANLSVEASPPFAILIATGNTDRQVKAIHDGIHQALKDQYGLLPRRVEGLTEARWVLMDYLDVVVHVFTPETRDYYRLEQLWGEVPSRAYVAAGAS